MDPLTTLLRDLLDLLAELPDSTASFILRAALFLGVTTGLAGWAFRAGSRSQFIQLMAFTVGLLVATFLPVDFLIFAHPGIKGTMLLLSTIMLLFLPMKLPFFLTPNAPAQKWLRRATYGFLFLMFLISW